MNKGSALNGAPVCRHCSLKIKLPTSGNLILEAWVGMFASPRTATIAGAT